MPRIGREKRRAVPNPKYSPDELANIPLEDLIELKDTVDRLLRGKIAEEKQALLQKLEVICRFEGKPIPPPSKSNGRGNLRTIGQTNVNGHIMATRRAKAPPKYRNPLTGETWAGRGLQPRWLRKAIEADRNLSDFLIHGEAATSRGGTLLHTNERRRKEQRSSEGETYSCLPASQPDRS
jgi:DNA-binding protein H-NS